MTIEFTTIAQHYAYDRLKRCLDELGYPYDSFDDKPLFRCTQNSAMAMLSVRPAGEAEAVIRVISYVVTGANISDPELLRFLLEKNSTVGTGGFGIDDDGDIFFTHAFLGSTCEATQVKESLSSVLLTADALDDVICARWGGKPAIAPPSAAAAPPPEPEPEDAYLERLHREYVEARRAAGDADPVIKEEFFERMKKDQASTLARTGKQVRYRVEASGTSVLLLEVPLDDAPAAAPAPTPAGAAPPAPASPEPTSITWCVNVDGGDSRDMSLEELAQAFRDGVIHAESYVWTDSMTDWAPLNTIPALAAMLGLPLKPVDSPPAGDSSAPTS